MFPVSGYRHAARTVGTPQLTMFRRSSVALACRPRRRNRDTRTSPRQAPGKEKERALVTGPGCRHLWSTSREPSRPIAYMTSSPSMLSSLATIACVCFLAPYRSTTTVEGFIAPSPPSARLGGSLSSSSSASALGLLEGLSGGACLGVESLSNCYRSSATQPRHSSGDRRRNDPRGGGGDRRQPARMAASSRVNGADVSQDLSQLNGAEEATPVEVPAATQRVRWCFSLCMTSCRSLRRTQNVAEPVCCLRNLVDASRTLLYLLPDIGHGPCAMNKPNSLACGRKADLMHVANLRCLLRASMIYRCCIPGTRHYDHDVEKKGGM